LILADGSQYLLMDFLGRTNASFPPVWLSPQEPVDAKPGWVQGLMEVALEANTVIDVSRRTALFGGSLRGKEYTLMVCGGRDCGGAVDSNAASHMIHAHLVSTLSSIGRDQIDFYFLDYRSAWEEHQINGALEAMETAKQDGLISFLGLYASGSELAALGMWQFHDGFDVILVPGPAPVSEAFETLSPLARERRVGLVTLEEPGAAGTEGVTRLVRVTTADEVRQACG